MCSAPPGYSARRRPHDFLHRRRQLRRSNDHGRRRFPESGVDVLIIETTRGDSPLPEGFTRAAEERRLAEAIERVFREGGCILMPVFALGKTQEALGMIYKFRREKLLGEFPVYIGGLEREDDRDLRSARAHDAPAAAATATTRGGCAVRPQRPDHPRFAGARRQALRALQRNDDAENAFEYFRAPRHRKSAALDFLRRLRRSGIAGRSS